MRLPVLFISHGAPLLALDPTPAHQFLTGLGRRLPKPAAILVISAHYQSSTFKLTAAAQPQTIHDFGGFPDALYRLQYPAPGQPELATRIQNQLHQAGFESQLDPNRGLDHGAWVPLLLMYPEAEIPVIQLSLLTNPDPELHYRLGACLAPLREQGVLILGSGSATHNLREVFSEAASPQTPDWVEGFQQWLESRILQQDRAALLAFQQAPHAKRNHPTTEHFLPLLVALGASTDSEPVQLLHQSYEYRVLAMDAYAWGQLDG